MARLIDADELLIDARRNKPIAACLADIVDIQYLIRDQPTVDAAPVVHGTWEEWYPQIHMIFTGEEMLYRCSACTAKYPDVEGFRYCPFCGAMMDGGADCGKAD